MSAFLIATSVLLITANATFAQSAHEAGIRFDIPPQPLEAALDAHGVQTGETRPVYSIAPESVIVTPAPHTQLVAGRPCRIWGRAWGDLPIAKVHVSVDGGILFREATLAPRQQRAWQRFDVDWTPDKLGACKLLTIAEDVSGQRQPLSGSRNSAYEVAIEVAGG